MSSAASARQKDRLARIDVFVLTGGQGTRIHLVLGDLPKVLAPIGGRPYLAQHFDRLRRFGVRLVLLSLGQNESAVVDFSRAKPPAHIEGSVTIESEPLGTADAFRFARLGCAWAPCLS